MDENAWSRPTLWNTQIEAPTTLFLVTFWDAGTADPLPIPAGERTVRVWAKTRTGAVAIVQQYFTGRGQDFRIGVHTLGMQLVSLLSAMHQWLWESVTLVG